MIIKLLLSSVAIFAAAYLLEGVTVKNFGHAILTAILLAIASVTIKPILVFFTLPITIITLGLFYFVINVIILMIIDAILSGLKIKNFWWAAIFSILISIFTSILNWIF
ncbi:MAG: hypothetical protein CMO01_07170 [Thalassobius sp.]|nr:hypothetical protein [Thalassovita sp.]